MTTAGLFNMLGGGDEAAMQRQLDEQRATKFAEMTQDQRFANMGYSAGAGLGRGIAGAFGVDVTDPTIRQAAQLRKLASEFDTTTSQGMTQFAEAARAINPDIAQQAAGLALTMREQGAKTAKAELSLSQEKQLRDELAALGPSPTEDEYLKVVRKYGDPDKVMTSIQASSARKESADAKVEAAKIAAEAKLEAARVQGATQLEIARMAAQSRAEIAQLAASLKGEKPLTEFQGKSVTFGTRAAEAHNILNSLEGTYSTISANYLPSFVNSEEGQKAKQAQDNFVNAVLRQESGAAINSSEFSNAKKQYFPQPGDSEAVLAQKRQNRETVIKGFARQAGPGGVDVKEALNAVTVPSKKQGAAAQIPSSNKPSTQAPVYATNPTTKERIMSTDGGVTWTQAR